VSGNKFSIRVQRDPSISDIRWILTFATLKHIDIRTGLVLFEQGFDQLPVLHKISRISNEKKRKKNQSHRPVEMLKRQDNHT